MSITDRVLLLLVAGICALILWLLWRGPAQMRDARRAAKDWRRQRKREAESLSVRELRDRILKHEYFSGEMQRSPSVNKFLNRIARGDARALAKEFSGGRLYRFLVRAEREVGLSGRPLCVDYEWDIALLLKELADREAEQGAGAGRLGRSDSRER